MKTKIIKPGEGEIEVIMVDRIINQIIKLQEMEGAKNDKKM